MKNLFYRLSFDIILYVKWIYSCKAMAVWSLRGLVVPRHDKYKLLVLQEAAVGSCNGSGSGG